MLLFLSAVNFVLLNDGKTLKCCLKVDLMDLFHFINFFRIGSADFVNFLFFNKVILPLKE